MGRDETLLQVRRAEEEAEQIIKEAQESQKAIIAAARRQAIKATQEGEERLRIEFDQTLSSQREGILARGKDEGLRVRTQATTRADKVRDDLKDNFVRALDAAPRTNG
jgi:V/A-type H+-transporting ATPase subunit G/H